MYREDRKVEAEKWRREDTGKGEKQKRRRGEQQIPSDGRGEERIQVKQKCRIREEQILEVVLSSCFEIFQLFSI